MDSPGKRREGSKELDAQRATWEEISAPQIDLYLGVLLARLKRRAKEIRATLGYAESIPITTWSKRCGGSPCVGNSCLKVTYVVEMWLGGYAEHNVEEGSFSQAEVDAAIVSTADNPDCVNFLRKAEQLCG